ncbi:hypothetical protein IWQ62_002296 [Dispira parvispora]|uniref:Arrestin-like N-terminal domain-containing protein n=1 Tax=Dispira parvispora TaxID=1520584 RepID=A0A9W8AQM2_9FUNG|nr:hypothetical protein IWQ62_002296 [Dispira parvispora]
MDQVTLFNVTFPSYTSTPKCQPNSVLSGAVMLKLEGTLEMQRLTVTIKGREKIALSLMKLPSASSIDDLQTAQRTYFKHEQVIIEPEQGTIIPPGVYLYHFTCNFPNANYPASVREMHFAVQYSCSATLYTKMHKCHTMDLPIVFEPILEIPPELVSPFISPRTGVFNVTDDGSKDKVLFILRAQFSQPMYLPGDGVSVAVGLNPCVNLAAIRKTEFRVLELVRCYYSPDWANQTRLSHSDVSDMDVHMENPLWVRTREVEKLKPFTLSKNTSTIYPISRWVGEFDCQLPSDAFVLPCAFVRFSYVIEVVVTFWSGLRTNRTVTARIPIPTSPDQIPSPLSSRQEESVIFTGASVNSRYTSSAISSVSSTVSYDENTPIGSQRCKSKRGLPPQVVNVQQSSIHIPVPNIEAIVM